ncbi:beta-ketoacyl-[acyl-carrier-protein] synthase family protein [Flavitalea flava]
MSAIFIVSDNIVSPLGVTTADNFLQLKKGISGVKRQEEPTMSAEPFYASLFEKSLFERNLFEKNRSGMILSGKNLSGKNLPGNNFGAPGSYTRFEQLLIASISDALQDGGIDTRSEKTILILSSTKGNISLLETPTGEARTNTHELSDRISMTTSARLVAAYFGFVNPPVVISNACISGIMAILTGMRLIRSGRYGQAVVAGADVISKFVLSGFQSFQAISPGHCKPFDKDRDGINLGEGAATVILSSQKQYAGGTGGIKISGGAISNDANHLSAPSRTGEELGYAITKTIKDSGLSAADIDFISAHGTATVYNDEMEAKAITLANLQSVPVNSLKGYYGHTLGAAGLIETIVSLQSLKEGLVLPTLGFEYPGLTEPLNICTGLLSGAFNNCLKTASGFGGCNAALVLSKA